MRFDTFDVGDVRTTSVRQISSDDIGQFADLTGDHNPIHLDDEVAADTVFGRRIAHGLLVQSCAVGLLSQLVDLDEVIAYHTIQLAFKRPVFVDDSIRVVVTVAEKKLIRRINAGNVSLDFRVVNGDDETVQQGCWTILMKAPSDNE